MKNKYDHGFIPDLRNAKSVPYFYNNVWRDPGLAQKHFGKSLTFIQKHSKPCSVVFIQKEASHIALELARAGYKVCYVEKDEMRLNRTISHPNITKFHGTIKTLAPVNIGAIELVCSCGALGTSVDLAGDILAIKKMLQPKGQFISLEPCYREADLTDALVVMLFRTLLALGGKWHEDTIVPTTTTGIKDIVIDIHQELLHHKEKNEEKFITNDPTLIVKMLNTHFDLTEQASGWSIAGRLVGGVRGEHKERIAAFIRLFDEYAVDLGLLLSFGTNVCGEIKIMKSEKANPYTCGTRTKSHHQKLVEEFNTKIGRAMPDRPTLPSEEDRVTWAKLLYEEMQETLAALNTFVVQTKYGPVIQPGASSIVDLAEIIDGCADIMVIATGLMSICGVADMSILETVNWNNLAKVTNGHFNEHHKFVKAENHSPPDIDFVLMKQTKLVEALEEHRHAKE